VSRYQVSSAVNGSIWFETDDLVEAREYRAWLDTDGPLDPRETAEEMATRVAARPFRVTVEVYDRTQPPYSWWEPVPDDGEVSS
jgi:hypothetical protein